MFLFCVDVKGLLLTWLDVLLKLNQMCLKVMKNIEVLTMNFNYKERIYAMQARSTYTEKTWDAVVEVT